MLALPRLLHSCTLPLPCLAPCLPGCRHCPLPCRFSGLPRLSHSHVCVSRRFVFYEMFNMYEPWM